MYKIICQYGDASVTVTTEEANPLALEVIARVSRKSLVDLLFDANEMMEYQADNAEKPSGLTYRDAMSRDYLLDGVDLPEIIEDEGEEAGG